MKKIIILSMTVSSLVAAHTNTNWYVSMSRGQMFSIKKIQHEDLSSSKLGSPVLTKFNLVHDSGLGFTYINGKNSSGVYFYLPNTTSGVPENFDYKFKAYMLSYDRVLQPGIAARFMLGISNQNYDGVDIDGKFAAGGSLVYHFDFTKTLCAFVEGGYLKQSPFTYGQINYKAEASGGYISVGISKAI